MTTQAVLDCNVDGVSSAGIRGVPLGAVVSGSGTPIDLTPANVAGIIVNGVLTLNSSPTPTNGIWPVSQTYPGPADGGFNRPVWLFIVDASAWALLPNTNWGWLVSNGILRENN